MKPTLAMIAALVAFLFSINYAEAKPYYEQPSNTWSSTDTQFRYRPRRRIYRYRSHYVARHRYYNARYSHREARRSRFSAYRGRYAGRRYYGGRTYASRIYGGRTGGRPRAWCGWFMRTLFGGGAEYNLAANWAHRGSPSRPRVGAIVVWRHHVGVITGGSPGSWVVKSGNYGGRVAEVRMSTRGAIAFRTP